MKHQLPISSSDRIVATLTLPGDTIVSISDGSFGSLDEIIARFKGLVSSSGLGKIFVRNFTQGWHLSSSIYLRPAAA